MREKNIERMRNVCDFFYEKKYYALLGRGIGLKILISELDDV